GAYDSFVGAATTWGGGGSQELSAEVGGVQGGAGNQSVALRNISNERTSHISSSSPREFIVTRGARDRVSETRRVTRVVGRLRCGWQNESRLTDVDHDESSSTRSTRCCASIPNERVSLSISQPIGNAITLHPRADGTKTCATSPCVNQNGRKKRQVLRCCCTTTRFLSGRTGLSSPIDRGLTKQTVFWGPHPNFSRK
ncbi:unnamed protein product, partial [Ectocarpus sp. 4 AP-2014]